MDGWMDACMKEHKHRGVHLPKTKKWIRQWSCLCCLMWDRCGKWCFGSMNIICSNIILRMPHSRKLSNVLFQPNDKTAPKQFFREVTNDPWIPQNLNIKFAWWGLVLWPNFFMWLFFAQKPYLPFLGRPVITDSAPQNTKFTKIKNKKKNKTNITKTQQKQHHKHFF